MDKIEWETPLLALVPQLRRLQYAANSLNYNEFCEALGWPRDDYTKAKFLAFQQMGRMHVFDDGTLTKTVEFYERREERYAAERKAREESLIASGHARPAERSTHEGSGDDEGHPRGHPTDPACHFCGAPESAHPVTHAKDSPPHGFADHGVSRPADAPMADANIPSPLYATNQGKQRHTKGGPA